MQKLLLFLRPLVQMNYRYPLIVLLVTIGFAILGASYAVKLTIDTDIANLLPRNNPSVLALEELQETVGSETVMEVAIRSPDFDANIEFTERLMEESLQLYDDRRGALYFTRAEFRRDTESLQDNALYLATTEELQEIISWLEDEIETAREESNPFFIDFSDDEEENTEDDRLERFQRAYDELIPSEYPVNQDSTLVILTLYPSGSKSNLGYLEDMFVAYDDLIQDLNPAAFHPGMEVRFGGRLKRHLNELDSIMNDVFSSFALGISSVILLVMFYFFIKKYIHYRRGNRENQKHPFWSHLIRAPIPIAVIGIPLLISLCWTFGITYGVLGTLNTMTSVLFVILFGLGIDYGIHYYARYIELRSDGKSIEESLIETYEQTGAAILVSGLTTAVALYILIIADFRGFSEFGFISGTGILFALVCMLFVLPSLLVLVERLGWVLLNKKSDENKTETPFRRYPFATIIVTVSLLLSVIVLFRAGSLDFEYEFGNLEPVFEEYESFREFSRGVDESSRRNPAYIVADSDEHVFEILDVLRERKESNPESMISEIVALQERFPPSLERAEEKLNYISEIRSLLANPFIVDQENEDLDLLRRASQTTEPLADDEIPDFLTNRFMTRDGEIGRFIIIYPDAGLSDGRRSIAFKNELADIRLPDGEEYHAGSTSIVAAEMLELMRMESPYMVTATFVLVFIFMYFSFRSFRWSMMAMIPLVVGFLFLFGIMLLFGLKFNFYNLVVLPAILGIGCDNGVHIAHRYRIEGRESVWHVLSSTGQHISIGSLTTMMGFAGLLFTNHPGLRSIGIMAVAGIGMTLLTALTFLPAMIQILEERDWIKF